MIKFSMHSVKDFSILYEGADYASGEMDIKKFAPSLLAFGQLVEMANQAINEDKATIQVSIRDNFENKCFKCNLTLYGKSLLDNIPLLTHASNVIPLEQLLEIIGFVEDSNIGSGTVSGVASGLIVASYIAYKGWEKGRKVESYIEIEDSKGFKVRIAGEEKFVSRNLFKLIQKTWSDPKITPFFNTLQEHLTPSGYKKYRKGSKEKVLTYEELEVLKTQEEDLNIQETTDYQEIKTTLRIRTPDLEGDKKWEFMYVGTTIKPSYSEEVKDFLRDLRTKDFNLKYCSIPVKLRVDFTIDKNGEKIKNTEKYTIVEITGEVKLPPSPATQQTML